MSKAEKENLENISGLKGKQGEKRTAKAKEDENPTIAKKQKLSEDAVSTSKSEEATTAGISSSEKQSKKRSHASGSASSDDSGTKKIKLGDDDTKSKKDANSSDGLDEQKKKKPFHRRMKHTLGVVLEQMEFYFGDSSLSKDRFLRGMVDSSPEGYVDLCVFANFNKLQTLHKDGISRGVLIQALSRSAMLQLNADKTKVRRTTPFKEISQDETDKRTVYVEHLPSHATHMWIKQVFSQCGKVVYVSLPVYKTSKQTKGFAFVEFETPDGAERACSMLNNPVPDKAMDPPGKFPKGNKTLDRLKKFAPILPTPDNEENDPATEESKEASTSKSAADAEAKKKKKKKTKKKKPQESSSTPSAADSAVTPNPPPTDPAASEQKPEAKKKKKKRKRKLSQSQEPSAGGAEGSATEQAMEGVTDVPATEDGKGSKESTVQGESSAAKVESRDVEKMSDKKEGDEMTQQAAAKTEEDNTAAEPGTPTQAKKRKKKKKKNKVDKTAGTDTTMEAQIVAEEKSESSIAAPVDNDDKGTGEGSSTHQSSSVQVSEKRLSHKERKLLRQEDIRRKRQQRLEEGTQPGDSQLETQTSPISTEINPSKASAPEDGNGNAEGGPQPTSILKMKKAAEKKRVEFDPVPITTEFVEAKGARKRKKQKREKCHLRVITKKEWVSLKEEYISQQKSHMQALKESLRELRQQENAEAGRSTKYAAKRLDLEDAFGTKPLKLSHEVKMANVEKMKFTPNVIVQWWCTHEMHRDKIRTMFKETHAESIAYIDASEEAKSGHIRFKDETSAEEFAKMSRNSASFMARVLPADQQEEYWEKANRDRLQKLGRKKKEQGSDRIARKVFQRNKATFFNKPSRIVFDDADVEEDSSGATVEFIENEQENKADCDPDQSEKSKGETVEVKGRPSTAMT